MAATLDRITQWVLLIWRCLWIVPLLLASALLLLVAFVGFGPKLTKATFEALEDV